MLKTLPLLSCLLLLLGLTMALPAQPPAANQDSLNQAPVQGYDIPSVRVLGTKPTLLSDIPGSAAFIPAKTIRAIQPISGNEVFRTISGLHVVDEEGLGLRANIGIRGLDPDRSGKVLILEDGAPVALNPYGEPQMYYTPAMDRMESVEVLKGSGQILFGPQTVGGVINYITADPPSESSGRIRLQGGQGGYFSGLAGYGNTFGNAGFQLNYLHKRGDEIGPTSFRLHDLSGKWRLQLSERSTAGLKLGYYREHSNSTYVGLTQSMYDSGGQDYQVLAPDDRLDVERISASLSHEQRFRPSLKLKTIAYGYQTVRNWQRQDFTYDPASPGQTGVVWGDQNISGGAIYMLGSNGHRNRQFAVAGIEPRLTAFFPVRGLQNKLDAGLRFHYEIGLEQRVNGQKADARSGDLLNDEARRGQALSAFVQDQIDLSPNWRLSIGLRIEHYRFEREIFRTSGLDTLISSDSQVSQLIPGFGLNYNLNNRWTIFGGIHRGFAPPRIVDAITSAGVVYELDPELSWNSEVGLRGRLNDWLEIDATAFLMDFSNQIIPVTESSGGAGSGLINGGSTRHYGAEFGSQLSLDQWLLPDAYVLEIGIDLTYSKAFYNDDRFIPDGEASINIRNKRTPYSPNWLVSSNLLLELPFGLSGRFNATFVGEQFTDELNTEAPSANGRTGRLDSYLVIDGALQYEWKKFHSTISLAVKNLLDERYIASRRPQGIRVGLPRLVSFGLEHRF